MKKFLELSSWRTALGNLLPSAHGHQGGSRIAAIGSMLIVAFAFVGCDDSSSASAEPNDEPGVESSSSAERGESSSSVIPGRDPESSNSEKAKSSSDTQSDAKQSSSSEKSGKSSCSTDDASSSSVKSSSSSSVILSASEESSSSLAESSSSIDTPLSSSSEETIDFRDESVYDSSSNTLTDFRDGQTYRTVKIKFVNSNYERDSMVWMTENLNYAYVDVPYDYDIFKVSENHSDSSSWCYDNDAANCAKYGRLYTWAAAMDSVGEWSSSGKECGYTSACSPTYPVRGICPKGWHLPDSTEWNTLIAAGALSFVNLRTNSGYRDYKEEYYHEGQLAYFWSSSEYVSTEYTYNSQEARNFVISENNGESETFSRGVLGGFYKYVGNSVRCVKD